MIARNLLWASASVLAGAAIAAGQHHPEPHHGHHHGMAPGYDLSTETTMHCKVDEVDQVAPSTGCSGCEGGVHLRATCGGDPCDVHLGPQSFTQGKNFPLAKGDEIDVTGSRVEQGGETNLVAREVRKGDAVLKLRDEQGKPLWR